MWINQMLANRGGEHFAQQFRFPLRTSRLNHNAVVPTGVNAGGGFRARRLNGVINKKIVRRRTIHHPFGACKSS
jgi:hypothetical protein